ncbi:MAG: hypothetical protein MNSN_00970 [Minisyncoccus archaeiphilus]|jgi:hypothetical protein|uniref:hypothetical protein n=1 Tax=Minisyncoccus archaeiphilus TaxID=3238481 RepID=UPI0009CEBE69|nr:MAG: hypothetical protein BWY21_00692 [Parcubacteria group bacterium ADurb.Bin216]GMX59102.1 MAG: hypothetical protein MNSN_00970 [Candidatus Parcubacteria bacterium]
MNKKEKHFDNLVLMAVMLIGLLFIGVSLKAVIKEGGEGRMAASGMNTIKLESISMANPVDINGKCGPVDKDMTNGSCELGVMINKKIISNKLTWDCKGSGKGETAHCYAEKE